LRNYNHSFVLILVNEMCQICLISGLAIKTLQWQTSTGKSETGTWTGNRLNVYHQSNKWSELELNAKSLSHQPT